MKIKCNHCGAEIQDEGKKAGQYSMIYTCKTCGEKSLIINIDKIVADKDLILAKKKLATETEKELDEKREYYAEAIIELYNTPVKTSLEMFEASQKISFYQSLLDEIERIKTK